MQTKFVILAVVLLVAIGVALRFRGGEPAPAEEAQLTAPVAAVPTAPPAAPTPPPVKPVAAAAQAPIAAAKPAQPKLTPEQLAALEAQQEEQDQADATELIHSVEVDKRVEGAEQLGAFQNPQAEAELIQALTRDANATVREAAAQSLATFSPASPDTWKALVAAIEDRNADVQAAAESSLEALLLEYEEIPASLGWVQKAVKKLSTSKKVSEDTRESLKGLVEQWDDATASP